MGSAMFRQVKQLILPHGGNLIQLIIDDEKLLSEKRREAETFPLVPLTSKEVSDVIMLGTGAYSPLKGFMCRDDYMSVVNDMRLHDGILWPIPITLSVSIDIAKNIREGRKVALYNRENGNIIGTMTVKEKYHYDKRTEALNVFLTEDEAHPGVKGIYGQGDVYLGGTVEVFDEGGYPEKYSEYARPSETRSLFINRGWNTIAAFQTRNPIHRSHEYLTKISLEICDGLLIHPIVGKLKPGDIPAEIRIECYRTIINNYYPQDRVVLKVYPMEMRYGGPREALLHAIIRQNFGCSHIIIGRDHAGVGKYYGPFDAHRVFDELRPEDLYIKPVKMDWTFWCKKCDSIVSSRTCPHTDKDHLAISGTELRNMLVQGQRPPKEYGRQEVIDILMEYYRSIRNRI